MLFIRTESKEQEVILKAKNRKKNLSRHPSGYRLRLYTFYRFFDLPVSLTVVQFFGLVLRLTGQVDPQSAEYVLVNRRQNNRRMYLASAQLGQLLHRTFRVGVGVGADAQRQQHFIGVQTGVMVAQVGDFQLLDRLDDRLGNQMHLVRNPCQFL